MIVKGIDPFAFRVLLSWPPVVLHVLAVCCALLLVFDAAVSHFLMNLVRREIDAQEGDSTEEISRRVRELLRDRSLLLRRIQQAYPNWQARPRALTRQLKEAKANYRQAVRRARRAFRQAVKASRSAGKKGRSGLDRAGCAGGGGPEGCQGTAPRCAAPFFLPFRGGLSFCPVRLQRKLLFCV